MAAGDAPLSDRGLHGTDGRGENVGLLEDLGQDGTVQGAEGCGVVLLCALVELQHRELVPPGLRVPVLVLQSVVGISGKQSRIQGKHRGCSQNCLRAGSGTALMPKGFLFLIQFPYICSSVEYYSIVIQLLNEL